MYSLYRSWLDTSPSPLVPQCRNPLSSLPDVVVAVGDNLAPPGHHGALPNAHQFAAHRAVLSANSGYFKAVLGALEPPGTCITVSGVSPEAFAPLLAYMYTGYLDIGRDNIYAVLLATHYLHMPRALELCWDFLRAHPPDSAPATPSTPTLVKPIPGLPWRAAPPQPPQPPASLMVLPTAEHSPFRAPYVASSTAASSAPSPLADRRDDDAVLRQQRSPSPEAASTASAAPSAHERASPQDTSPTATPAAAPASAAIPSTGKVVIDVACCDGPVRFHRVLNSSYGSEDADENQLHQRMHVPGAAQLRRARKQSEVVAATGGTGGTGEYTCLYCNHTFKSHYCYQKHARRHLNPLTPKQSAAVAVEQGAERSPPSAPPRTPARPLDMNVQYYPCKTCGSKFPSYYFVHKHRKLCHSGEEAEGSASSKASAPSSADG